MEVSRNVGAERVIEAARRLVRETKWLGTERHVTAQDRKQHALLMHDLGLALDDMDKEQEPPQEVKCPYNSGHHARGVFCEFPREHAGPCSWEDAP
jgi:hypothetical protein